MFKFIEKIKDKKGQSLVEMALILPIILLLLVGILDFGRVMNSQIQISSASRSGARLAAIGRSDTDIVDAIHNSTSTLKVENMIITISPSDSVRESEDVVNVLVEYDINMLTPGLSLITGNPFRLSSDTSMIVE